MADLRIVDAPVLLQESITDDVKMPTGGLGNYTIRLGDLVGYVVAKEQLASKSYVDNSSKGVQDKLDSHISDKNNPHKVTKEQVGLGNVDNTADIDKPVSNAVNSAIITATTDMATKAYVNQKDNLKADKATTLSGYGITDAYTINQVDSKTGDLTTLKTADKTALVESINEVVDNTKGVVDLYNKNVELGAGANGWTDQLVALSNGRTQRDKNRDLLSIKDFGAIGDGALHKASERFSTLAAAQAYYPSCETLNDSIDRLAIQKSLDEIGYAYIPQGKYIINVRQDKKYFIKVGANQRVFGDGDKSLLKVADNNGDYFAIFHQDVNVSVDNTTVTNFAIHQNVTGNSDSVVTNTVNKLAICLYKFKNVEVFKVKVYEACGTNTIALNAKFGKGAIVHDCDIFWKQNNPVHYDNSAIYISCDNHWVYNNRFYGVIGESWGAIESHGSKGMVYNNKSFNYGTICNVTNYANADEYNAIKTTQTKVFDNTAINCFMGVRTWAIGDGVELNNVKIHNNTLYIAQVQWYRAGIVTFSGISTENSTTKKDGSYVLGAPIKNLSITSNKIDFELDANNEVAAAYSRGIQLYQVGDIDNVIVKNNEISISPSYGIYIAQIIESGYKNSVKNVICTDNTIIDAGCNSSLASYQRAAIFVGGKIDYSVIDDNIIKDTGVTTLNGYNSIYTASTKSYTDTVLTKQKVYTTSKQKLKFTVNTPSFVLPSTPKIITTASYPPPDGTTVDASDMIVITGTVAAGQPTAYVCTNMGTFGTLSGVTASMTAGSCDISISDLNNIDAVLSVMGAGGNGGAYPKVGKIAYLSGRIGELSNSAETTVSNATVTYYQPSMKPISYAKNLSTSVAWDAPSLATGAQQSTTVALTGAKLGDAVIATLSNPLNGTRLWAEVTAAGTVVVYHRNDTGSTVDLLNNMLTVKII